MKKVVLGTLVGAIIVFAWQTVSNIFLHYHDGQYGNAPNDAQILSTLSTNITKEGQYFLPNINRNATAEEQVKMEEKIKGKPWAMVTYHPAYEANMGTNIARGFTTALLCVLVFIGILGKAPGSFTSIFLKSLGLGFLLFTFVWYNQNIWMQTPWPAIKGELFDNIIAWGLCGLWLGWWLNRPGQSTKTQYR